MGSQGLAKSKSFITDSTKDFCLSCQGAFENGCLKKLEFMCQMLQEKNMNYILISRKAL